MHLSRQTARELPSFIEDPDFDAGRGLRLAGALRLPVLRDGAPVPSFVPGWRPDGLSLLFYPTAILQFRHVAGGSAYWLLDAGFAYLGSDVRELPDRARAGVARRVASIAAFLNGLGEDSIPYRIPDDVTSFLMLAEATRREILASFGHSWPTRCEGAASAHTVPAASFVSTVRTDATTGRHFVGAERGRELLARREPVILQPGWRIACVSSLFFPVFVADLRHEDGRTAYWFFDRHGGYIIDRWDLLPEPHRSTVAAYAATMLEDLWQDIVAHPGDRTRDHVAAFLALPASARHAIFDLRHSPPDPAAATATWTLTDPPSETTAYVAQTEAGAALLQRGALERALSRNLQGQNIVLANEGRVSWPSVVDSGELEASGFALLLDSLCFAYRVQDLQRGFTFYVIAYGGHFRTFGIYLPENNLLVARDAAALRSMLEYHPDYRLHLLRHAVDLGDAMLEGFGKPQGAIYHSFRGHAAMQIGHFIWQDLSGVSALLDGLRPGRVPSFLVPDSDRKPEIFGPIDAIFPGLQGHVVRTDGCFASLLPALYREHARVIKATSMFVPRAVGSAVLAAYKASPALRALVARCHDTRRTAGLVVLVGLRMGNRTFVDMRSSAMALIDVVIDACPDAVIVIDGQNADPDAVYDSWGDSAAPENRFLRQEIDIARELAEHAAARGVTLINVIGRPIAESVLWCDAADFFVAPWGAALAKYRWICSKPGLVVTGRWNLLHRSDLAIYHGEAFNERPAAMWFNEAGTVEDVVDAGEADVTRLERSNFRVDMAALQRQLVALLKQSRAAIPDHDAGTPAASEGMERRRQGALPLDPIKGKPLKNLV